MKLQDVAKALAAEIVGDGEIEVRALAHPAEASGPEDLALAMSDDMVALLAGTKARAAVVGKREDAEGELDGYVVIRRARYAMSGLTSMFDRPPTLGEGVHPTAFVEADADVDASAAIGPFAYVGRRARIGAGARIMPHVTVGADAEIGAACLLFPGVRIGERVRLGERVIVHQNASLGADGFSFVTPEIGSVETAKQSGKVEASNTEIARIQSLGSVVVGDDAEIGACTSVDRGTVSDTRIGKGTKIDDLVMIGHNVVVGENCMICAQVGIAGSSTVGDRVVLAGQVGVADHCTIGDDVVVGAGSGVGVDLASKQVYLGYPAIPHRQMTELYLHTRRLPLISKDVAALKKRVKNIERTNEKR